GSYVGTSNQLRQIDDYSLYSVLDSIEVAHQLTTQQVASVAVLANKVAPPQAVSTAAAMQFYLAHPILFARQPAQIHVREIMLHDEATARRVLDQLHRGASFAELAQRYSIDPPTYRDRGGDLGWVKPGQMPDSWDAVAYGLAPSQTSDVFKVLTMYCIVQVIQGPRYDAAPFDALSPSATVVVAQYLQQQQFLTWLSNRIVQEPLDIRDGSIAPLIQQGIADLHQYPDQNVLSDEIFQ
ncbi:MAG TPA: peptidylprolyl isomerase, partial [Ktedonobacterales bacterium]|nr:peptidylprolyl isomerase [Ktedonobacterales bacterium]